MWTTRDLQDAAAAGALVEGFESDFLSEEEEVVVAAGVVDVLLDEPERLSVR